MRQGAGLGPWKASSARSKLNACITSNLKPVSMQVVFDYIEVFYNRVRRHAASQNQVPADYAQQFYKDELQIAA